MQNSFYYRHAILIKENTPPSFILYIVKLLEGKGFDLKRIDTREGNIIYAFSQTNEKLFLQEAQFRKIKKFYTNRKPIPNNINLPAQVSYLEGKKVFSFKSREYYEPEMIGENVYNINYYYCYNQKKNQDTDYAQYGLGLFTENEMQYLEMKIFTDIEIDQEYFLKLLKEEKINFNENELKIKLSENRSIFNLFIYFNFIELLPLHYSNYREKISYHSLFSYTCPYYQIRNYYGDKIGLYFSWLSNYQSI
jgi:hypothetical protein